MRDSHALLLVCLAAISIAVAGTEAVEPTSEAPVPRVKSSYVSSSIRIDCGSKKDDFSERSLSVARLIGRTGAATEKLNSSTKAALDEIYKTYRYADVNETEWGYDVFVPPGNYQVTLHFAETSPDVREVGKRRFDVNIQHVTRTRALDVFRQSANKSHMPLSLTYSGVRVKSNVLSIRLLRRIGRPELRALDVVRASHESLILPFRMNVGSTEGSDGFEGEDERFRDRDGYELEASSNDHLAPLRSARIGNLKYVFPVDSDGHYDVTLYFAEIEDEKKYIGARVFGILVNNVEKNDIEVYAAAGKMEMAYTFKSVHAPMGKIVVELVHQTSEPLLNAIVVDREGSDSPSGTSVVVKAMNVGGEEIDGFEADNELLFVGNSIVVNSSPSGHVDGTFSDVLFQQQRVSTSETGIQLSLPVDDVDTESYTLDLKFAETEHEESWARVMDVFINGLRKETVDIYDRYGEYNAVSLRYSRIKPTENGTIEVQIVGTSSEAMLSGFMLHKVSNDGPAPGWNTIEGTDETDARPRHENCAVQYKGDFYMIGGRRLQEVNKFDTITKTWSLMEPPPIEVHHMQCVVVDDRILIGMAFTGEYPHEQVIDRLMWFHPGNNSWTWGATIPKERNRGSASAVLRDGFVYFINGNYGGHGPQSVTLNRFDAYDPVNDEWHELPDTPVGRDHGMSVLAGDKIVVIGGRNGGTDAFFDATVNQVDVWEFAGDSPTDGRWVTAPEVLKDPSGGALVGELGERRVILAGGEGFDRMWARTAIFDPVDMRFIDLGQGDMKRVRHGTQMVRCKNGLYAPQGAGWQGGEPELTSVEVFTLDGKMPEECKSEE